MPAFDLRYINVAEYTTTDGVTSYGARKSFGDAMGVNLELKHADGRLYAEGKLAEYIKLATGGTVSPQNRFNQFPQRNYSDGDMTDLETALLSEATDRNA